jgi:hypothetical protein
MDVQRRERLARLVRGGSIDRPIPVTSASVIELRAANGMPCPICRGQYRILEHTRPVPGIRCLDVECRHCSTPRSLYFTIIEPDLN